MPEAVQDRDSPAARAPAATAAGDEMELFYRELHPRLWAYLMRIGRDPALAEELTQEAFVRLLASRGATLPPDERRAYLYRIAENLLRDEGRRRTRERAVPLDDAGELAGVPDAAPTPPARATEAAFAALGERERKLLWLAHVEEWSHREIARLFGLATDSVKVILHRARRRLARNLELENER